MWWSKFRDAVRTASRKGASSDEILAICDSTAASMTTADGPNRDYLEPNRRVWESFRDGVKGLAQRGEPAKAVLALCDKVRDQDLVELGIALDDQDGPLPRSPEGRGWR